MKIQQKTRRKIFTVIAWVYLPLLGAVSPVIWIHVILSFGAVAFKSCLSKCFESAHDWMIENVSPTFNRIFGVEYILTEARRLSKEEIAEVQKKKVERMKRFKP